MPPAVGSPASVAIVSSLPPDGFGAWDGTSMAAPHIIEAVRQANDEGFHAIVLAAFCDPAIEAARAKDPLGGVNLLP